MLESVDWCSICSSRPADGILTVLIEGVPEDIPACELCVINPEKVEFI